VSAGALAVGGWLLVGCAAACALLVRHAVARRVEITARACHELRGPLTAARLGLQLVSRTGELSAARLRAIDLELGRAALALDDLTSVRDPGRLPGAVEVIDLAELLADSVEAWSGAAAAADVELALRWSGASAHVVGDRLRLAQAIGNLIANAIEHGAGGASEARPVEVHGRAERAGARIEVSDHGPGLPASVAELARRRPRRRRGRRIGPSARDGRGRNVVLGGATVRGHGLAIALAIANGHGGRLSAAPSVHGARLVLELPAVARLPGPAETGECP
jgi:signal transduction histidine kinase